MVSYIHTISYHTVRYQTTFAYSVSANIAAVKAIGYRRNDYFGELYPISNALDGFDPTGLDPSNCALIDNTNHQYAEFTITFDTFHVISGINLHGADGKHLCNAL